MVIKTFRVHCAPVRTATSSFDSEWGAFNSPVTPKFRYKIKVVRCSYSFSSGGMHPVTIFEKQKKKHADFVEERILLTAFESEINGGRGAYIEGEEVRSPK